MRPDPKAAPGDLTCRELVALVTDYLEDTIPRQIKDRLEEHLRGCEGCATYLDQIRILLRAFGRLREEWVAKPVLVSLREALAAWKQT
ncbi:MAG: zf-HC2 domain-containing protein [Chloroflexi bacterium]|nr:zf-HC2 domain-containing protein [Chloroflexota bacterium]